MKRYERQENGIFDIKKSCFVPYDPRNCDYIKYLKKSMPTEGKSIIEFLKKETSEIINQHYRNRESHKEFGKKLKILSDILKNI